MKKGLLLLAALSLSACGTLDTVVRDDEYSRRELSERGSHCDEITRVYSGVVYDFCQLHADPDKSAHRTGPLLPGMILDMAFSGVLDTVVLPYTVYRQVADGNIVIPHSTWKPSDRL
ncbi:YceK/YidQ family lipoprotein [uncultured Pseudomonas sp.]|uniref:YceK/YidQ family lipoprotein n=1 Tax=uncultured Pseudomonas sp. TaxID=114707 RepID=UPI0025DF1296|nr:YceK/YidQ family lipoprotein [uncultured Pseudomonas sp.]